MTEKLLCIVTPQARTYYKAVCVAKEFLDKDQNIVNTTGTIPDGEVLELSTTSVTKKHFESGKLHGKLEIINLTDNTVSFTEKYEHGRLMEITEHTVTIPIPLEKQHPAAPIYPGTTLKTGKNTRAFYVQGKQIAEETLSANGATLELLGNIPDGEAKEFTDSGKLKTEATYKDNKLNGLLVRYDEEGKLLCKETYEQGTLKGPAEYYSYTQQETLHTLCNYKNALLEGDFTVTQSNGAIREQATYQKGKMHGLHRTYYSNGKLEVEEMLIDGKIQGTRKLYFPDGQLWFEENYVNGRLDGDRTEFFADGRTRLTEFYCDGMLNGQRNIYDPAGQLISCEEYHWGNIVHNTEYREL